MLLIASWNCFCQDTKTVKISTLVQIYKESRKCDSLKVAYSDKSIQLNNLIDTNLNLFKEIDIERSKSKKAQEEIDKINKDLKKKNNSNTLLYGISGAAFGIIVGVLIN